MSMMDSVKKAGFRAAYSYLGKDPDANIPKLMDWVDRFAGDCPNSFPGQRAAFRAATENPEGSWYKLIRFIHYSDCNIREKSLLDCLHSPMFMACHDRQPFSDNHLKPCPMLENPEKLREMGKRRAPSPPGCNPPRRRSTCAPSATAAPRRGTGPPGGCGRAAAAARSMRRRSDACLRRLPPAERAFFRRNFPLQFPVSMVQ